MKISRVVGSPARRVGTLSAALAAAMMVVALLATAFPAAAQPIGAPTDMTIFPPTQTLSVGQEANVYVVLRDAHGNLVPGSAVTFEVSGANTNSSPVPETSGPDGKATFTYTGTNPGMDTVTAYGYGGMMRTATVKWLGAPATISITPASASDQVGASQSFTVKVSDSTGTALPGVPVLYSVTNANSASGKVSTGANGTATFSYKGAAAGTDKVTVGADSNANGVLDPGEPTNSATVTWTAKPSQPGGGNQNPPPPPGGGQNPPPTGSFGPAQAAAKKSGCAYFETTGHNLCAGFEAYWNKFGGLAVFGMPLTEEFQANGVTVQYFERARFEYRPGSWPERFDTELGLVGNEVTAGRSSEAPFKPATKKTSSDCTYFAETGHNLCGGFAAYWQKYGGLAIYGMPISEEFQETNPDTGQVYTVQYFERARFEWHPGEWPERYDVELGRLGAQILKATYGVTRY